MGDNKAYAISPDNYLLDQMGPSKDHKSTVNYCSILIQRNNIVNQTNNYVLGTVFLYNYYLVFDWENTRIGFNGPIVVNFSPLSKPSIPFWIILVIAGVVAIVGIAIFCFIRMRNKRLQKDLGQGLDSVL